MKCVPKGSGSENMSFLKMCVPADGVKGIKQFVLESIVGAGGKPCPPGIVGVGIGGSADYAMYLAKEAIMRPIGTRNADPMVAQLEDELFGLLNETGIGPMGLGGDVTVLQCHIEHADTHMTLNPVAVNYQCWAARRASGARRGRRRRRLRPGGLRWRATVLRDRLWTRQPSESSLAPVPAPAYDRPRGWREASPPRVGGLGAGRQCRLMAVARGHLPDHRRARDPRSCAPATRSPSRATSSASATGRRSASSTRASSRRWT